MLKRHRPDGLTVITEHSRSRAVLFASNHLAPAEYHSTISLKRVGGGLRHKIRLNDVAAVAHDDTDHNR